MTDNQNLLAEYVQTGSDATFRELVACYVDLVYSTALRLVGGDTHRAEDVAQTVFINLARVARTLPKDVKLGGWLHRDTCFTASTLMRGERRRQSRERQAVEMNALQNNSAVDYSLVAPVLDEAINELGEADRIAILLRFFEQQDFRSVGQALRSNEHAARMRVTRALEKLEAFLKRQGITTTAASLGVVLSATAVQAAPVGLAFTISTAAALTGTTLATTATATTTKAIAMTALQKTLVTATIAVLAGAGIYEARQAAQLREQVRMLQQQLAVMTTPETATEKSPETASVEIASEPQTASTLASTQQGVEAEWAARLLALNTTDWRQAFATGEKLAALSPNTGFAILQANWTAITNVSARQQLLKAFDFALHERLPAMLDLGLNDGSPEVQSWALIYLKDVALQDFSSNYTAGKDWLSAHRDLPLSAAFADAVWQATATLRNSNGDQLRAQLNLLKGANQSLSKFPDVIVSSGLSQMLAEVANGSDAKAVALSLDTASRIPLGDEWRREVALSRLDSNNSWEVREAAARVLGRSESEWALQPLLDTLSERTYSTNRLPIFSLAQSLADLRSPKAIPTMIALIEAENTYHTIYGIGYYGLGKLTGVAYDEKHDGAWWRQWWENNKQRYPADAQSLEIPRLNPIKKNPNTN